MFIYRTTDALESVLASGYFNDMLIDINLHDLIIHEKIDSSDATKVERNLLCVTAKTLDNINTVVIKSKWEGDIEQAIADLETYINNNFVKIDGSSVMSAPLKFAAGSFRGAVGPGLNGVTFLKMDSDGNMIQIGSLSDTQFNPSGDNTTDLGNSIRKLKTVYANNLNNGYDIAIPVTHTADTVGLKSQIDDAANSGEQLYTTGVWYAKMYAETTAPSADNGTNYADFSQVDNNNKPIIVIYTRTSGAWVETTRITPPANHNGYMTITSKIWDIAEQAGQQGGLVLWAHNQETFTPYPRIVSFDGANITNSTITTSTFQGSATLSEPSTVTMPASSDDSQIVNKKYVDDLLSSNFADRDLSNLTSTGKNIGNWSTNVSNCIVNIPQDINLSLSGTTLTLKAGSKVYVPNGSGVFDIITIAADITVEDYSAVSTGKYMLFYSETYKTSGYSGVHAIPVDRCVSGSSDSSSASPHAWYDTTNNAIKRYFNGSYTDTDLSLPLGIVSITNGTSFTSIDQVFNGFGYIGSTVFVLPNVKYLVPNGRNADGTLNNTAVTITSVKTRTFNDTATTDWGLGNDQSINQNTRYTLGSDNYLYASNGIKVNVCAAGVLSRTNGVISSMTAKTVFHAVDYSEADFVVAFQRPTSANNYTWYRKYKSGWVEQGGSADTSTAVNNTITINLPITMANDRYTVNATEYSAGTGTGGYTNPGYKNKTTVSFDLSGIQASSGVGNNWDWVVKGMAA